MTIVSLIYIGLNNNLEGDSNHQVSSFFLFTSSYYGSLHADIGVSLGLFFFVYHLNVGYAPTVLIIFIKLKTITSREYTSRREEVEKGGIVFIQKY
jgi:hypothetical protein